MCSLIHDKCMRSQQFCVSLSHRNCAEFGCHMGLGAPNNRHVCPMRSVPSLKFSNNNSIIEFTAGVTVCCMPSISKILKHVTSPVPSIISSYRKALQSVSIPSGPKRYELGSVTSFQRDHGNPTDEASTSRTLDAQKPWVRPGESETQWAVENRVGPRFAIEKARIRRTTDINVVRQPCV